MKVTVCGGGNAAHVLVPILKARGVEVVRVYTPFPQEVEKWERGIAHGGVRLHMKRGNGETRVLVGKADAVTADPRKAVQDADLVLMAVPAFAHEPILDAISPPLTQKTVVGAMPARGGLEYLLASRFSGKASPMFFGTQTLPWACRIQEYGRSAQVLGQKRAVGLATWPSDESGKIGNLLRSLTEVNFTPLPSMLSLTLSNMGQLLHPGIMYGLFSRWDGTSYPEPPLFYQGVDEVTAEVLAEMSEEMQAVGRRLEQILGSEKPIPVPSLREWLLTSYEGQIGDTSSLRQMLVTNAAYDGLRAPMTATDKGYVPDFGARYLAEDVPFGLVVTRGIAEIASVSTPAVDQVIEWAQKKLGREYLVDGAPSGKDIAETRAPQRWGIHEPGPLSL